MAEAPEDRGPLWPRDLEPLPTELLEEYLAFTGAPRPTAPTLDALAALQTAHLHAIPFEYLDALLGLPVPLDLPSLAGKLLGGERGGYCFEHNLLFAAALTALGYRVELLSARIVVGQTEARPRTHLGLRVLIDGEPILSDVGFGRTALRGPLRMIPGLEQRLVDHDFRLTPAGGELLVEARPVRSGAAWEGQYILAPQPQYLADVVMANHWVSTHPTSTMKERVLVLQPREGGKRSIGGGRLVIDDTGRTVDCTIGAHELEAVLREEFGIRLPAPIDVLDRAAAA